MEEKRKYIKELLNAYKSEVDNFNDAIFEDKFDALTTDIVKLFAIPVVSESFSNNTPKCKDCKKEMIKTHYRHIFGEYVCKNKECKSYCDF